MQAWKPEPAQPALKLVQVGRNIPTVGSNDFSRSAALPATKVATTNPCRTYAEVN